MLGLHCCEGFPLAVASGGDSLVAVSRLHIAVAILVVEHGLSGTRASVAAAGGPRNRGSWAPELRLPSCGRSLVAPQYVGSPYTRD